MQTKSLTLCLVLALTGCSHQLPVSPGDVQLIVGQATLVKILDETVKTNVAVSTGTPSVAKIEATTTERTFIVYGLSPGKTVVLLGAEGYSPAEIAVTVSALP